MTSTTQPSEPASSPPALNGTADVDQYNPQGEPADGGDEAPPPGRRWLRVLLLTLGPLLFAAIGGYLYVTGERYVETDNAYIKADKVSLSAQISGAVTEVLIEENTRVVKGQELFRIDAAPFEVALARAQARLEGVRSFLTGLKAGYRLKLEELKRDEIDVEFNDRDYNRQLELWRKKLTSAADLDKAKHELEMARQQIAITRQALNQIAAQLGGDPERAMEDHPVFREVRGMVDDALLNIRHTVVTAPYNGVAQKRPEPGQYVLAGEPVMVIVADQNMWIEANFKETELTYVRPGQPVRIKIDSYPELEWHGTVTSLSQASGAEFSLLPAQNATGNWVKVVQRIPIRIAIEARTDAPELRAGLSTIVTIDTRHRRTLPGFLNTLTSWLGLTAANNTGDH